MAGENKLATAVVELARTLVEEFDILDFLQTVTTRTSEVFGGSTAMLLLTDQRGALQLVAISPPEATVSQLMRVASAAAEQPVGRDGAAKASLDVADLAPDAADAASALGLRQVEVVRLRIAEESLGALVLLDDGRHGVDVGLPMLEALGGLATLGLLQQRSPRRRELLAEQLQTALNLRIQLEQATGMVAEMTGLPVDAAFLLLQAHARQQRRPLSAVAHAVVDGGLTASDLAQGPPPGPAA
jgi:hypothetical protein